MKFVRIACLNLDRLPSEDGSNSIRVPNEVNDITVEPLGNWRRDGKILSLWKFEKSLDLSEWSIKEGRFSLSDSMLDACHRIIRFFSSYLSIVYQVRLTLSSPLHSFALVPESVPDREALRAAKGIQLARGAIHTGHFTFELTENAFDLVCDRSDGLEALAEALRLNSELAKYREFIRLFEIAFAHAGVGLYKPLLRFLSSGRDDFTKAEVRFWFEGLRSRAIHGDREEPIFDFEIAKSMERMNLAAYDVFFNKKSWRSSDVARRRGMIAISGPGFLTSGKEGVLSLRLFDEFGAFPLNTNAVVPEPTEDWWRPSGTEDTLTPIARSKSSD